MTFSAAVEEMARALKESPAKVTEREGDRMGPDGLQVCGTCGEPKQIREETPKSLRAKFGATWVLPVPCRCDREKSDREKREEFDRQFAARTEKARRACFEFQSMRDMTFERDDRKNAKVTDLCKGYADNFQRFKEAHAGLLFFGAVGTGKTFHAACIANAIMDKGYRALFTNLSTLATRMSEDYGRSKLKVLKELTDYDLVILDDLGVERTTPTMNDSVYQVINTLYQSDTVMVLTTNLNAVSMTQEQDPDRQRIYSRLFDCCKPVKVEGGDRRRSGSKTKEELFREVLG